MERHPLRRRVDVEPPPATPAARHYCIREVGVLAEQGVLDRARMLLARRVQREPRAPEAFLDAIRLELTVPSSGSAWRAWLERAFEGGVEIADRIASIVPEPELSRALADIAPRALLEQASRDQALDLLRARAARLLVDGDARALDALEGELIGMGARDPQLRELQRGVLLARALAAPEAVDRLGRALMNDAGDELAAELRRELELARAYHRLALPGRLPPLDAALALLGRCDAEVDGALCSKLARDMRARPGEYLAWADAAAEDPTLLDALCARAAPASSARQPDGAAGVAELTVAIAQAIESDPRRFVPLPSSERALYRKHVRPKALAAIVERSVPLGSLAAGLRDHKGAARRALAQLEGDAALRLVDRIARLTA